MLEHAFCTVLHSLFEIQEQTSAAQPDSVICCSCERSRGHQDLPNLRASYQANGNETALAVLHSLLLSVPRPRTPARSDKVNNVTGVSHHALNGGSGHQREPIDHENPAFPTMPETSV